MRFRDLLRAGRDAAPSSAPTNEPLGGGLERLRRDAQGLLSAGDEAIARALSGNSQAFLTANRQQGGE